MSARHLTLAFERSKQQGNARVVLLLLADSADRDGVIKPNIEYIEACTHLTRASVRENLSRLVRDGEIEVIEKGSRGDSTYRITLGKSPKKLVRRRTVPEKGKTAVVRTNSGGMKIPSFDAVKAEFEKKGRADIALDFWNYQESTGWVVGHTRKPMKSWKSAIETWLRNEKHYEQKGLFPNPVHGRAGGAAQGHGRSLPGRAVRDRPHALSHSEYLREAGYSESEIAALSRSGAAITEDPTGSDEGDRKRLRGPDSQT